MIHHDKFLPTAIQSPLVFREETFKVITSTQLEMFLARTFNVEYNTAKTNEVKTDDYTEVAIFDKSYNDFDVKYTFTEVENFINGTSKREPGLYPLFRFLIAFEYMAPGKYLIKVN